MRRTLLLSVLALPVLAACSDGHVDLPETDTMVFTVTEDPASAYTLAAPEVTATVSAGKVTVNGRLTSQSGCYRLEGTEFRGGRSILLDVEFPPPLGACTGGDKHNYRYVAEHIAITPGNLRLQVVHEGPGAEEGGLVLDTTLVIP